MMKPLDATAAQHVFALLDRSGHSRRLAIHQAFSAHQPGLWGDDPCKPRSALLLRNGDGRAEAYGAGIADPAVAWLAARGEEKTALVAPDSWEGRVRAAMGEVARRSIETWLLDRPAALRDRPPELPVRRLTPDDGRGFNAAAPSSALRGWGSYRLMIERGAAFAVAGPDGIASIAWIGEQTNRHDSIYVHTLPRYRRLGLARKAALALIAHVLGSRRKAPVWTDADDNQPSLELARSLGFAPRGIETMLIWRV